jgi:hypothetical protein
MTFPGVHMMPEVEEIHDPPYTPPSPVPVPVTIVDDVRVAHGAELIHEEAADFGAYFTLTFAGTEAPLQLLPYDVNRARAYITCTGTGPVYIGSVAGVTALKAGATGGQAPGFILATGITLPVTHKQAVYISPDGTHAATVSVAVERWES